MPAVILVKPLGVNTCVAGVVPSVLGVSVYVFVHVPFAGTLRPPNLKTLPVVMLVFVQGLPTADWVVAFVPAGIGIERAPPVTAVLLVLVIVIVNVVVPLGDVTVVGLSDVDTVPAEAAGGVEDEPAPQADKANTVPIINIIRLILLIVFPFLWLLIKIALGVHLHNHC